jgi:hypothetical protein
MIYIGGQINHKTSKLLLSIKLKIRGRVHTWATSIILNRYCRFCFRLRAALLYFGFHFLSLQQHMKIKHHTHLKMAMYAETRSERQWKPTYNKAARRRKLNLQYKLDNAEA